MVCGARSILFGGDEFAFGFRYAAEDFGWLVVVAVEVELFDYPAEDFLAVFAVVDTKGGGAFPGLEVGGFPSQDAGEDAMEGSYPESFDGVVEEGFESFPHGVGGFACEGEEEDVVGGYVFV